MSVVEAEFQLLDVARKTEKFGVIPHVCENSDGKTVELAVTHNGEIKVKMEFGRSAFPQYLMHVF